MSSSNGPSPQNKSPMELEREQIEREKKAREHVEESVKEEKKAAQTPPPPRPENPDLMTYIKSNQRDTIAYVVLVIGVILTLFQFPLGYLLVGIVAGLYFSEEIMSFFQKSENLWEEEALPRTLIIGGVAIALILAAPFLFLGTAVTVAILELFAKKK